MDQYLKEFHETKNIFLQFRTYKKTKDKADDLAKKYYDDQEAKFKAEVEQRAKDGLPAFSKGEVVRRKKEWMAEKKKIHAEYCSKENHFDFPKLHLLSHFTQAIRKYGSLLGVDTESGELWHQIEMKGPWDLSNKHYGAMKYMLYSRERQYKLTSHILELGACMKDYPGIRSAEIQSALNHFRPEDIPKVNDLRRKHLPVPDLPYYHPETQENLGEVVVRLTNPYKKPFYADFDRMPGYNKPLWWYLQTYLRENGKILNVDEAKSITVQEYRGCEIIKDTFHKYYGSGLDRQVVRCYGKELYYRKSRNDDVFLENEPDIDVEDRIIRDENGEVTGIHRDMQFLEPAKLVRLYRIWFQRDPTSPAVEWDFPVAIVCRYGDMNDGNCEKDSGLCRVRAQKYKANEMDLDVVDIDSIWGAAHLIKIPVKGRIGDTDEFFVNHYADIRLFNTIWSRGFEIGEAPEGLNSDIDFEAEDEGFDDGEEPILSEMSEMDLVDAIEADQNGEEDDEIDDTENMYVGNV